MFTLQFTFQSQEISRITNGCPHLFPFSHWHNPPNTTEILYAILFSSKENMAYIDAFPGLISLLLIFTSIAIPGLSSSTVYCATMCHVKPSQFIHFLWYSIFSGENFHKFHQIIQIWNFILLFSYHTHDKNKLFLKYKHTFLPRIICI